MATEPATGPRGSFLDGLPSTSEARRAFDDQGELDRIRLALEVIDPGSQLATWVSELLEQLAGDGWAPERARKAAYRAARVAELLSEGVTNQVEIAARVGCSERTVRSDIEALRRLLEPRVTFATEREAA